MILPFSISLFPLLFPLLFPVMEINRHIARFDSVTNKQTPFSHCHTHTRARLVTRQPIPPSSFVAPHKAALPQAYPPIHSYCLSLSSHCASHCSLCQTHQCHLYHQHNTINNHKKKKSSTALKDAILISIIQETSQPSYSRHQQQCQYESFSFEQLPFTPLFL